MVDLYLVKNTIPQNAEGLQKHGYFTRKGKFGWVRKDGKTSKSALDAVKYFNLIT